MPGNAAAAIASGKSILKNGDFETPGKFEKWPDQWSQPKVGGVWGDENGNRFLRLVSPAPGEMVMVYRSIKIPPGTKALTLTWRQRLIDVKAGPALWLDARIMLEFKDASGAKMSQKPGPPNAKGSTKGWVEKSRSFLVPDGAKTLEFMPALFEVKKGTYDIDDIALVPSDPAPVEAMVAARKATEAAAFVEREEANPSKWPEELHVEGNRLVSKSGKEVWLQGISTSGLETLPEDKFIMKAAKVGVEEWKANIVRVPVKDEFWFGRNMLQKDGGEAYRKAVDDIINLVANRGAYVLLDLHRYRGQTPEHVEFWKDAATRYKNHPAVLFDLFNEPHDVTWEVWKNGGEIGMKKKDADEAAFLSAEEKEKLAQLPKSLGMQALVNAVREVGAKNIVVAGGISFANDLSGVTEGFALDDKSGNGIMYSWHCYNWHKNWKKNVLTAAEKYPIMVGEVGADTQKMTFIPANEQEDPYTWVPDMLGFIQKHRLNWTGWCMHPRVTPAMVTDWNFTPSPYWGAFAKDALSGKQFEMKRMR